jgi:hypothetical protein
MDGMPEMQVRGTQNNFWRYPGMDGMPEMQVRGTQNNFWRYPEIGVLTAPVACPSSSIRKNGKKIVDNPLD